MHYRVIKEARRTLRLFIKEEVIVKAPYFVTDDIIEAFVQKHKQKIAQKLQAQKRLLFLGKEMAHKKITTGWRYEDGIFYSDEHLQKNYEAFLIQKAREYLLPRVQQLADCFGDRYNQVRITRAKSRWGSCSSKKNLNFACYCMKLPKELIDYIIIHELCHLTHLNHSKLFWDLVGKRLPQFRILEEQLNQFI